MITHSTEGLVEAKVIGASVDPLRPTCAKLVRFTPGGESAAAEGGEGGEASGGAAVGPPYDFDLNTFNSCELHLPSAEAYREAVSAWCEKLASDTKLVEDGITGNVLRTDEQAITFGLWRDGHYKDVNLVQHAGVSDAESPPALTQPLLAPSPDRGHGTHNAVPVLLLADPGAGKTWAAIQLAHSLAEQ